ncbi:hypothetical protein N431DRAFT_476777 [Stipitochalara longipes BDJ]|nr:hypothetical protein N431DRAFT_476777 [Stipitochalara longipes BDJ]
MVKTGKFQMSVSTFATSTSTSSSTTYLTSTLPPDPTLSGSWYAGEIIGVIIGGLVGIALVILILLGILAWKRYANRRGQGRHRSSASQDGLNCQDFEIEILVWQHSMDNAIHCTIVTDTGAYEGNWVSEETLNAVGGESTELPAPKKFFTAGGQISALKKACLSFRNANTPKGQTRTADFYVAPSEVWFQILLGREDIRKHNILPPAFLGICPADQTKKDIEKAKEAAAQHAKRAKKHEKSRKKREAEGEKKRKHKEDEDRERKETAEW